jgi:hypothetical protein
VVNVTAEQDPATAELDERLNGYREEGVCVFHLGPGSEDDRRFAGV